MNEKDLLAQEVDLKREIAYNEFVEKGYLKLFEDKGIKIDTFNFIAKTPLHKNKNAIGIKKNHYEWLKDNNAILIIAMRKKETLKEHDFFVFYANSKKDTQFLSGYTDIFQFINFRLNKVETLRSVEEYMEELNRPKETKQKQRKLTGLFIIEDEI
jgi:hypothetical protein